MTLREWRLDDAPAVEAACQDPEIAHWIPFVPSPYTNKHAEAYLRDCIESSDARSPFAIVDEVTGMLLGSIDMQPNPMRTGHIGYWVVADARGRGVCTGALSVLVRWHSRNEAWSVSS